MPNERPIVLVASDAEAPRMVPGSIFDRHCGTCNRRLMIAPSGQQFLKDHPESGIICSACWFKMQDKGDTTLAAEPEIILREATTSIPNFHRRRN